MATRKTRSGSRRRGGPSNGLAANRRHSPLQSSLARVARDLTELDFPFALVGGLAVSARAEPRFTRDADLAIAVRTDAEAEKLIFDLQARGYEVDASIEQSATGRLATVRTRPPGAEGIVVDLLFASSGIEEELVREAEVLELFEGVRIRVATRASLVALKVLSRGKHRPQDDADLAALLPALDEPETLQVESLLRLISARGYSRDKKLIREFRRVARQWRMRIDG